MTVPSIPSGPSDPSDPSTPMASVVSSLPPPETRVGDPIHLDAPEEQSQPADPEPKPKPESQTDSRRKASEESGEDSERQRRGEDRKRRRTGENKSALHHSRRCIGTEPEFPERKNTQNPNNNDRQTQNDALVPPVAAPGPDNQSHHGLDAVSAPAPDRPIRALLRRVSMASASSSSSSSFSSNQSASSSSNQTLSTLFQHRSDPNTYQQPRSPRVPRPRQMPTMRGLKDVDTTSKRIGFGIGTEFEYSDFATRLKKMKSDAEDQLRHASELARMSSVK